MFNIISSAMAQEVVADAAAQAPASMGDAMLYNFMMIAMIVVLFWFLVISPQRKRMREHNGMLAQLDKGIRVVTQGGIIGTIVEIVSDYEMILDVNGTKMSVLRSSIMGRFEDMMPASKREVANDTAKAAAPKAEKAEKKTEKTKPAKSGAAKTTKTGKKA